MLKFFLAFLALSLSCLLYSTEGKSGFGPGRQDYGYVNVRKGAHMFYWLYYKNTVSLGKAYKSPLVIWLQGGPGASSAGYGNFAEIGTLDYKEKRRPSAWTKHVNVLYIDNPVGTGFSYVDSSDLYATNNDQIADDLVSFIKQFYKRHRKFARAPLYIFTESYGGKMTIQFAYQLYQEIRKHKLKINFKGVALGDSWISPIDSCLTWAPFLLQTGEIDYEGYKTLNDTATMLKNAVDSGNWNSATSYWAELENAVVSVTHGVDFYNILYEKGYGQSSKNVKMIVGDLGLKTFRSEDEDIAQLMNGKVKKALKIPDDVFFGGQSQEVFSKLVGDFMKPVINYVEKVLNETKLEVNIYSGQLDLIVDTPGTLNWVEKLKWRGAKNWEDAPRYVLPAGGVHQGFVKSYGKFTFYWMLRAGHMVPTDNPNGTIEMLRLITKFKK